MSASYGSGDDWDELRPGRLVDDEEDVRSLRQRIGIKRARSALGGARLKRRPPPVVVKMLRGLRTSAGVARTIAYVGRLGGNAWEPFRQADGEIVRRPRADAGVALRDGSGHYLDRDRVLARTLAGWEFDDRANTTVAARLLDAMAGGGILEEKAHARASSRLVIRLRMPQNGSSCWIDPRVVRRLEDLGAIEAVGHPGERVWQKIANLPIAARYREIRARHLVLSVPTEGGIDRQTIGLIIERAIFSTFENDDFPTIWALHRTHGQQIHAHVIVCTTSELGRHLIWDAHLCDRLRQALAEAADFFGLAADWTRIMDRPEAVDGVHRGNRGRRERATARDYRDGLAQVPSDFRQLERVIRRAPNWLIHYGREYIDRVLAAQTISALNRLPGVKIEAPEPPSSPKPQKGLFARLFRTRAEVPSPEFPPLPPELERLAKRVGRIGVYGEGIDAALRSFDVMRRDDARLAAWYLRHQPAIFGTIDPAQARRMVKDCAVREAAAELRPSRSSGNGRQVPPIVPSQLVEEVAKAVATLAIARVAADFTWHYTALAAVVGRSRPQGGVSGAEALELAIAVRDRGAVIVEDLLSGQGGGVASAIQARVQAWQQSRARNVQPRAAQPAVLSRSSRGVER